MSDRASVTESPSNSSYVKRVFDLSLFQRGSAHRDPSCSDEGKTVQPKSFSHDPETGTALSKSRRETTALQAMF